MGIESLDKIVKFLVDKPTYGFALLISAFFITLIFWYMSSYIKETGKQRVIRKNTNKAKSSAILPEPDKQDRDKNLDSHFPSVTFSDGTLVDVIITINFRIFDAYKYTYEASKPLEILKTLVDSRVRQVFEKITIEQARERRRETEIELKHDLSEEFLQYGIELKAINIGAIQVK